VIEVYHSGDRVSDESRKLLLDRFGATVEHVDVSLEPGDWIVFHVANNRLRHHGTKYFAMAAARKGDPFGYVSDFHSPQWSSCDDPGRAPTFIRNRLEGTESRAVPIARPWEEGLEFMKHYAGDEFPGEGIWGTTPSTWLKFVVPGSPEVVEKKKSRPRPRLRPTPAIIQGPVEAGLSPTPPSPTPVPLSELTGPSKEVGGPEATPGESVLLETQTLEVEHPRRWPVQVLSATYGTGGKDADVTKKVTDYVQDRKFFAANPRYLGVDPNPYWNKGLHIVYLKDGVRRHQHRNENEHILPESFYGPQDAGELGNWLPGTRWVGPRGEVQFHESGLLTGPGLKSDAQWETLTSRKLRLTWKQDEVDEFLCDYVWGSFKTPDDGKNSYRLLK